MQGLNQPLALNANLHSARPDNLVRTVLDGVWQPAFVAIGHMPAFRHALDDAQIAELAAYRRRHRQGGQSGRADAQGRWPVEHLRYLGRGRPPAQRSAASSASAAGSPTIASKVDTVTSPAT